MNFFQMPILSSCSLYDHLQLKLPRYWSKHSSSAVYDISGLYCNSLLYGVPDSLIRSCSQFRTLPHIWLVTGARRCDHITPVLQQLQWLSVRRRVDYKVACLVHHSLWGHGTWLTTTTLSPTVVVIYFYQRMTRHTIYILLWRANCIETISHIWPICAIRHFTSHLLIVFELEL